MKIRVMYFHGASCHGSAGGIIRTIACSCAHIAMNRFVVSRERMLKGKGFFGAVFLGLERILTAWRQPAIFSARRRQDAYVAGSASLSLTGARGFYCAGPATIEKSRRPGA
jgi:hypothetical protein